ncbi:SpaA isopeptide-forming pilin-related protein [Bifidobacterium sp. SO1]|uniref:SpaA isopeptide-forming pilin-related protein n=1 Tax=Bifidobacterium sp. SO1 TaxID=2809029 RepID=UPI001BDCC3EC|nr:hypothetical protein [Bifidobacterium sp. SO1]
METCIRSRIGCGGDGVAVLVRRRHLRRERYVGDPRCHRFDQYPPDTDSTKPDAQSADAAGASTDAAANASSDTPATSTTDTQSGTDTADQTQSAADQSDSQSGQSAATGSSADAASSGDADSSASTDTTTPSDTPSTDASDTGDTTDTPSAADSGQQSGDAGNDTNSNPGADNAPSDGNAAGDSASADQPAAAPAATVDCTAVADWPTLKQCIEQETAETVTITKAIPAAGTITVARNVTIDIAADAEKDAGINGSLEGSIQSSASIFTVNAGASLTIKGGTYQHLTSNTDGALADVQGTVNVVNGTFTNNVATGKSGGVFKLESKAAAHIIDGTFANNTAVNAGVVMMNAGSTLTIDGGMFSNNNATGTDDSKGGGVIRNTGGTVVINDGTFDGNRTSGQARGGVIFSWNGGKLTVAGGAFTDNSANYGGVVLNEGDLKISGGTFTGNESRNDGGVVSNNGTLEISGGKFADNKALGDGGGAISQDRGSTSIIAAIGDTDTDTTGTGITFTGNKQTFESNGQSVNCTNDDPHGCRKMRGGGGAVRLDGGSLTIQGKVTFDHNYSRAYGWGAGGGAIYVQGTLYIRNDSQGNKPSFDHNWSGIYDTQYVKDADGKEQTPNGGAGGALFVQDGNSTAYLMGGSFTNNSSGYLGGAIYTEEESTTYIAKAVASGNTAGHFGGGLWLCPSGSGEASKGGNIALFDNRVDKSIDPNQKNQNPNTSTEDGSESSADGTEAGSDFAIMNPYHKKHDDTSFVLMDTWFTDRTKSAVTWYRDGIPVRNASGYDDEYQNPHHDTWDTIMKPGGNNVAVTKYGGQYAENGTNEKIDKYSDHMYKLTLGSDHDSYKTKAEFKDRGVALKAVITGSAKEQQAKKDAATNTAAVVITGNRARLSGGAFGTNGNVLFSTPWIASWSKVDSKDSSKQLAGSQWDLTTQTKTVNADDVRSTANTEEEAMIAAVKKSGVSGPYSIDYYPTLCSATYADNQTISAYDAGYTSGKCWKPTFENYQVKSGNDQTGKPNVTVSFTSVTLSAVVIDDMGKSGTYIGFDNNPEAGGFDLNNLAPGTYSLKERVAPTGYELNPREYQFNIVNGPAKWYELDSNGDQITNNGFVNTDINIPDKALPGVSWGKVDADTAEKLPYSEWTVTKYQADGETLDAKSRWIVQDCTKITDEDIDCARGENGGEYLADHSNDAGKFNISGLQPGKYLLQETIIPNGYWNPESGDRYEFTIPANAQETVKLTKIDTHTEVTDIANKLPQIAWKKVAKDGGAVIVSGKSSWTITGPEAVIVQGDIETDATAEADSVTAAVVDCQSLSGSTDPCSGHATGLQTQTDESGNAVSYSYNDLNNDLGQLKVSGLQRPTSEQAARGIVFRYTLTETAAPDGYVKSTKQYVFTIGATESGSSLDLGETCSTEVGGTNCIPNVKMVAALPLTGGPGNWAARDWMLAGGGIAAVAIAALALTNEWLKRKAVIV